MSNRKDLLRENYKKLRDAGFSAKDATRMRGGSKEYLERAINIRQAPPINPYKQAARTGKKVTKKQIQKYESAKKRFIKEAQYPIIGIPPTKTIEGIITYEPASKAKLDYLSKYTYIFAYKVKHRDGLREWKYITVTSEYRYSKEMLLDDLRKIFNENDNLSKYQAKVIFSSIVLVSAYKK